ncbi:MAG: hypothetical protein PHN84_00910 [Desulfuromonadaceae bacterium]|nr:hypothetical protein [Desulfuromonadaceae bacterium]MDD2854071.1 hypothetical protein [Desulfuromonadaceae bacterium]
MPKTISNQLISAPMLPAVFKKDLESTKTIGSTFNKFLALPDLEKANVVLE